MASPSLSTIRRPHYGWLIAGVTFLTLLAGAGLRATPSVLIVPIEQEFGWSRATISAAISVNLVLYGLFAPFSAAVMDRLGVRRTATVSLGTAALGIALTPLITAPWQLVLIWGVVVGSGTGMTALVLGAVVANRWFHAQRGMVMGLLSASTATGQLVFLPLLASVVQQHGWRSAVLSAAGMVMLVLPVIVLVMRERPADLGLAPYGQETQDAPPPAAGNPLTATLEALRLGLRSRDFWLLAGTFFVCGASTNGLIGTHLISACIDQGIAEVQAASLLAMMGIFDLVGTTASGWLSDRLNNRHLLFWYYGLRGLSLFFLPYAFHFSFYGLSLFAVFYGLDWIATVPPTVRLTAGVFGRERAGIMFGWIFAAHQMGAAFATLGAGQLRTALEGYLEAFMIAGGLCFVAAVMALMVGPRKTDGNMTVAPQAAA